MCFQHFNLFIHSFFSCCIFHIERLCLEIDVHEAMNLVKGSGVVWECVFSELNWKENLVCKRLYTRYMNELDVFVLV